MKLGAQIRPLGKMPIVAHASEEGGNAGRKHAASNGLVSDTTCCSSKIDRVRSM
jgi:hypothetical protein